MAIPIINPAKESRGERLRREAKKLLALLVKKVVIKVAGAIGGLLIALALVIWNGIRSSENSRLRVQLNDSMWDFNTLKDRTRIILSGNETIKVLAPAPHSESNSWKIFGKCNIELSFGKDNSVFIGTVVGGTNMHGTGRGDHFKGKQLEWSAKKVPYEDYRVP